MPVRTIQNETELAEIAREVLALLPKKEGAHILALTGDLGAGKTAFVKALARELCIPEHITSPTFVIIKSYQVAGSSLFSTLTHIDAYRIEDESEMRVLGFEDILKHPGNVVCVEWPERIKGLIPKDVLRITISINKDSSRTITYGE